MTKRSTELARSDGLLNFSGKTAVERINDFLALAPTVADDPTESMLNAVLAASDPQEWNDLFTSKSLRDSNGATVRINAYRVNPSDFPGGLKFYLVLDVTDLETGAKGVLTCSSQMAIAQILNAEARVNLPIDVIIREKDKPTRAGFRPIHLEYIGKSEAPLGDPQAVVSEQ